MEAFLLENRPLLDISCHEEVNDFGDTRFACSVSSLALGSFWCFFGEDDIKAWPKLQLFESREAATDAVDHASTTLSGLNTLISDDNIIPESGGVFTGPVGGITPVADEDLTTKLYIDLIETSLQTQIDGESHTVAWAWQRGDGGRSFGFSGGHFHENWSRAEYRRLMTQAVLWSLKLSIPEEGVDVAITDDVLSLPPTAE